MHLLNKIFDEVFVINLKRRPDRLSEIKEELARVGIKYTVAEAVDGNELKEEYTLPKIEHFSYGDLGCILSHLHLVSYAYRNKLKSYFVFEDDAVLRPNFNKEFEVFLSQLPENWDGIYFGGNHMGGTTDINSNVAKIHNTYTTHAFGVKSNMYEKMVEVWQDRTRHIDVSLSSLHKDHNFYVSKPHLAWQRDGFSDIQNKYQSYDFLK